MIRAIDHAAKKMRDLVRYRKINLMDSIEMRMVRGFDIIFCRNVLIYFDDNSKKKVIAHLYDSLNKGGYLFVGFFGVSPQHNEAVQARKHRAFGGLSKSLRCIRDG